MSEVAGISLKSLEAPIRVALMEYSWPTAGIVEFDLDAAVKLELTPDKPNSARSATQVRRLGNVAGTLYVIAFKPGDGTGDESAFRLADLDTGDYPHGTKVVPRSKAAAYSEVHLSLVSLLADSRNADPILFAGNQSLLGLRGNRIVKLADLGQDGQTFQSILAGQQAAEPTATLTAGYRGVLARAGNGERFGDPHSVYNGHPDVVQVCGFFAVSPEDAERHLSVMRFLGAVEPR